MMDKSKHQWAAMGVSGYPLTHPIVGQGRFGEGFRHFIHLVDNEAEQFAHVYAVIAQWGVGKSRLGYELIAQINGSSRGWWVRDEDGQLVQAQLFRNDADRDQYLGLYIRYSQVANDYNNIDNWFAFGLYKALLPLGRTSFDGSIQGQIAREANDRLIVAGFDPARLAEALEVSAGHSDEALYEDPVLATRLCQAAYDYLRQLGIKYVMVVLDELETAAEAATFGLDASDIKHLDGRAIKLMGKAIKEEDPRRKLPWLRYVALCSPAIGDELREIQSTARRFELAELQSNAFADVSDFVHILAHDGRLAEAYPRGLVEAAYAMSGGNFGWFNVIMAGIDERLRDKRLRGEKDTPSLGALFDELVRVSGRVRQHVLDHNALEMLRISGRSEMQAVRELLYGQLPVPLQSWPADTRAALLSARNEFDEPVATRLRRVEWDELEAADALRNSKFSRDRGLWRLGGVDQALDLRQLLSNLSTYAIHESGGQRRNDGKYTLVVPLRQSDFVHLVALLYPHPAAEDAARALWRRFLDESELPPETATHIGPSIEMIERLDLRHRRRGQASLIFRDPDQNAAHEKIVSQLRAQPERERARQVLVGAMRVIDQHWAYDAASPGLREDGLTVIATAPRSRGAPGGGLVACDALKLHPKSRALFAWVKNEEELRRLCTAVKSQFSAEGRTPVVAFTASRALLDIMASPADGVLQAAKGYLMLYQLTSAEEHVLHQVGMPLQACEGFQLDGHGFTTAFNTRLQSLVRQFAGAAGEFRHGLDAQGRIAWPLRSTGRLKDAEQVLLLRVWQWLAVERQQPASLADLDENAGIELEEFKGLLAKLGVSPKARAAGYLDCERAGLFTRLDDGAQAQFPPFLAQAIRDALAGEWTFARAEQEWFWGYVWEGAKPRDTYGEWMALLRALGFARVPADARSPDVHAPCTRAELRGATLEADNWLKAGYPKLVADMEQIFGSGRVLQLFAPLVSDAPGTKTLEARRRLQECLTDLDALDKAEAGALPDAETLRASAQRRRRVMGHVQWVYRRDEFQSLQEDPNVKTLDFENDGAELWRRIRRASLFVGFVQRSQERIRQRARSLADEMRTATTTLPGFPCSLFTLSLEKIEHILDGALENAFPPGATALLQVSEPGSLRQHLRDLRVVEATQQLELLAAEVGVDLATGAQRPLEQIEGHIAATFRELQGRYGKLSNELDDAEARVRTLDAVLNPAVPADFTYPAEVQLPHKLRSRVGLIRDSLESVRAEEVDRLRSEFDAPARLGKFQPLMAQARGLLEEPARSLGLLLGQVLSAENTVNAYRERLAGDAALARTHRGLEVIAVVTDGRPSKALLVTDLQAAGPLIEAHALVKGQTHRNEELGSQALAGTGVSFERWCAIVEALDAGKDPLLQPHEGQALVDRGLVQRTYRLGGRA